MFWIAGVCVVCLGVCLPLFMYYKKSLILHLASAYKSLGTLCAFLLVLTAAIRLDPRCYVCAAAIFLYAVADFLLEYHFMFGAGLFLAGHIFNIAFFLNLSPVSAPHLICFLLLGGAAAYVFYRWRNPIGRQMPVFIVYGLSLVFMSVCAVCCFAAYSAAGILIAVGGSLFIISDFLLLRRLLFPSGRALSWAVMIIYYVSVLCFGIACLQL